jgi:biopolymer transport protein ExbD
MVYVAAVLMLGALGCTTTGGGGSTLRVSLLADGKVAVGGRQTALVDLPKVVKAAGARSSTSIEVEVSDGTTQAEMMKVTTTLRNAGYVRVLFTRPRRAEVSK